MSRLIVALLAIAILFSSSQLVTMAICEGQEELLANYDSCEEAAAAQARLVLPDKVVQYNFSSVPPIWGGLLSLTLIWLALGNERRQAQTFSLLVAPPPPRLS
ncbi:MAG: hypothetical protein KDE59_08080 [Anaerolineales bacterium]|nr:hypothetical protein [Anaerolineales bacterium]MCB0006743.1 hypothetical protein [Anaerolineales bacterium]MCB0031410.1 hypothetical protein [Anaerolineales bacterium]